MEMEKGLKYPAGFRFHPSDEELIVHYLHNKLTSRPLPASVIAEIDLYKFNPWELPEKAMFGEDEWYFFSPRERKYPNGKRPNRAAGSGFWKATGTDRPILSCELKSIGVKKALVFYTGRPPKGTKTQWIMNEYRLNDSLLKPSRSKGSMRLDDWVLCRVRVKGNMMKNTYEIQDRPSPEWTRLLPKIEEAQPTNSRIDLDDYLYKDCQVLASILSDQTLSPPQTVSGGSIQGSIRGNSFTKRKPSEDNGYENLLPSNKKQRCEKESNPWADFIDLPELNEMAFTDHIYSNEVPLRRRPWLLEEMAN